MRVEPGRELGDFTIGEPIGEGGHGVVYRAHQRGLDRDAVIKVQSGGDRERFLREAKLASQLDHPYAAHVYAFGAEPEDLLWIAMELVRGTTLRDVLAAQVGGRLAVARLAPFLDALCEVVHTAHDQGIVHRDLKPENIMVLSRAGRLLPKLLDLGIAKPIAEAGGFAGTPQYMAPEQWTEGAEVGIRADVYALGVIVYEALAGRAPFAGASAAELARAHLHDDAPTLPADLPDGIDAAVRRAMAKQPADRFAGALDFARAIRAASGSRVPTDALPRLDDSLRAELAWMPQPIAEAITMLEAAANPHQARDAVWQLVRATVRWCGVVAIAARSQLGPRKGGDAPAVTDALRELYRREPSDREWFALVRALVQPFAKLRDAYPVPELIDLAAGDPFDELFAMHADDETAETEETLRDRLARMLPAVQPLLRAVAFFAQYPVIVPRGDRADVWLGARRGARPVIAITPGPHDGQLQLADVDGNPLLQLAPLVQIAKPSPNAPDELFVFAGAGRIRGHGARLISEPHGFERHDDAVWTWFRRELLAIDGDTEATVDDAPYRGLLAFTEADAGVFFGRERATEAFVNQLRVQPMVAVVGPSGTGKSSFVRAGVVPALPAGWTATVMRPGATPMATFAARRKSRVIVIDQLEELFTLCLDPVERTRFGEALVAATADDMRVVMTIRDDFLARASELQPFRDRLAITLLATPDDDDLLRTLTLPARHAGYDFDAGLAHDMVTAVRGRPGALALLSFTALELWSLRDRHFKRLTRSAYEAIGGVEGALAQHAEATLLACSADDQKRVREAFRHLVTAEGTRAALTRDELDHVVGNASVVDKLIAARLLVSEDNRVEIVHEALLAAWPRLVDWRREDAEGARMRDALRGAARQWADRDRARGLLWRDDALDDYVRWRARHHGALPELDEAFASASVTDARRGRRIRRGLAGTAAVVLVTGVIGLSILYRSSRDNAEAAHAQLVESYIVEGERDLADDNYPAALRPLAKAYADGDRSLGLRLMLHRAMVLADQPVVPLQSRHVDPLFLSANEVVAVGVDGSALVVDSTGRELSRLAGMEGVSTYVGTALAPDLVVTARHDAVIGWTGKATKTIASLPLDPTKTNLAINGDATVVAVATESGVIAIDVATGARRWTAPLSHATKQLRWFGDTLVVATVDGKVSIASAAGTRELTTSKRLWPIYLAGADRFAIVGDAGVTLYDTTSKIVGSVAMPDAYTVALSPDGKIIAVGTGSGVISIADSVTGKQEAELVAGSAGIQRLGFTPDGKRLVSAGDDQTVRVWDAVKQRELVRYEGLRSSPTGLAVTASQIAVTTADDLRVFPIDDPAARRVIDVGEQVGASQFTDGGDKIFTTSDTGVELWDARSGAQLAHLDVKVDDGAHVDATAALAAIPIVQTSNVELRALPGGELRATLVSDAPVSSATFSRDGQKIVTSNARGIVEMWNRTGARLGIFRGHTKLAWFAELSPDGTRVVSASSDRTARVWDVASEQQLGVPVEHGDDVFTARFDATGARFVTASNDRTVTVWDTNTRRALHSFSHSDPVRSAAIDPNGTLVAAVTLGGEVDVWEQATGRLVLRFRHGAKVQSVDFAGDRLLSTALDGRVVVWDLGVSLPEPAQVDRFIDCHLSRDNRLVSRDRSRCP